MIERYLNRGFSYVIGGFPNEVFIQNYQGFIVPVILRLSNYYPFTDDFCLLGSLLKLNTNTDYILFDLSGRITGISEFLFRKIQEKYLLLNDTKEETKFILSSFLNNTCIFMIFPELIEVFAKFIDTIIQVAEQKDKSNSELKII